jgi:glutamate-1-semialdehyde 2,1-aminomutase
MKMIAPAGPVYQAGTLSGNPLAVAAGRAALTELSVDVDCPYELLDRIGARLQSGIEEAARRHGIPVRVQRQGSMLGLFFTDAPVTNLEDVTRTDRQRFTRVFHRLLGQGVHLPPSAYEALFLSTAHGDAEIDSTIAAFDRSLALEAAQEESLTR